MESDVDDFLSALRRQHRGRDHALTAGMDSADGEGSVDGEEVRDTRHEEEEEAGVEDEEREQEQQREQDDERLEQSTVAADEKR